MKSEELVIKNWWKNSLTSLGTWNWWTWERIDLKLKNWVIDITVDIWEWF